MAFFFRNFPLTKYSFGDNEAEVFFQKISSHIDLINQIKDEVTFYSKYTILDNERPDTLSYLLYKTVDYYWTFFLLNDKLRESGWPLTLEREYEVLYERYPDYAVETEEDVSVYFPIGQVVYGQNDIEATVIKKNLDLGQIILRPTGNKRQFNSGTGEYDIVVETATALNMLNLTNITYDESAGITRNANIFRSNYEYDGTHHWEDSNDDYVDIDPFDKTSQSGKTRVTYKKRFQDKNQDQREIIILRPEVANSVVGEFQKLLRS